MGTQNWESMMSQKDEEEDTYPFPLGAWLRFAQHPGLAR